MPVPYLSTQALISFFFMAHKYFSPSYSRRLRVALIIQGSVVGFLARSAYKIHASLKTACLLSLRKGSEERKRERHPAFPFTDKKRKSAITEYINRNTRDIIRLYCFRSSKIVRDCCVERPTTRLVTTVFHLSSGKLISSVEKLCEKMTRNELSAR